jgi:hypothetical protein
MTSYGENTATPAPQDDDDELRAFFEDRPLAHRVLFNHRHKTPPAGHQLITHLHHPPTPYLLVEGFRGLGKSTDAEEAIALKSGFEEYHNCLIVGAREDLAAERLDAIKNHITNNELFIETFGNLKGPVWGDKEIVLSNGLRILAIGRGQSMLGIKFRDWRPDLVLIDDLEKAEERLNETQRKGVHKWLLATLIPALDPDATIIMNGTHRELLDVMGMVKADIEQAKVEGVQSEWTALAYPIEYIDKDGKRQATWPDRYPLDWIDRRRKTYERVGRLRDFMVEYMLKVESESDKSFSKDMFRVEPIVRTWQSVYCMFDPARTVGAKSAMTGFAAWSYVGPKIVVWDAWGKLLMPNEILDSLFNENDNHHPVFLGVEEDGLNEWLMQPIRQQQLLRSTILPIKRMKAPKGKMDFIRGLQTYAAARELVFAKPLPDLVSQFLGFPQGRIDIPNALAYAQTMRPGAPMYDDFSGDHVQHDLPRADRAMYLALGAGSGVVTGALMQFVAGQMRVYADWVREGEPGAILRDIIDEAALESGRRGLRYICAPHHFNQHNNVGLVQAAIRVGIEITTGTEPAMGRGMIRELLQRRSRGFADVQIDENAHWVLNGMASGYARVLLRNGNLADFAEEGPYRVLIEAIEAFAGLMTLNAEGQDERNYRTRGDGTRYASTMPSRRR